MRRDYGAIMAMYLGLPKHTKNLAAGAAFQHTSPSVTFQNSNSQNPFSRHLSKASTATSISAISISAMSSHSPGSVPAISPSTLNFKCQRCGRGCSTSTNLHRHIRDKHENHRVTCSKCGKELSRESCKKKHEKVCRE
ncbi:hypothetical protein BGZ60DRAFT_65904 [Tricladium varicosporioides]|nr:hypothetical protein BGZ60DRAFT_65904 [Hymenoscyphus varicosporioides]